MHEYLYKRYALALYKVGEEKQEIQLYMDTIKEIVELIENNKELNTLLTHPEISTAQKKNNLVKIFRGKIEEEILSFLNLLVEKGRILNIRAILNELERINLEKNNKIEVLVKTVVPLNHEEEEKLITKLQEKYKKTIILNKEIDDTIIGGVFVKIGNDVIDGTIKFKLMEMKSLMSKGKMR